VCVDISLEEPLSVRDGDRVGAAVNAELREHPLDVCRDGLRADDELEGDLALISALREEGEYLPFSQRQRRERGVSVFCRLVVTVSMAVLAPQ
jgi:hypothetical protein